MAIDNDKCLGERVSNLSDLSIRQGSIILRFLHRLATDKQTNKAGTKGNLYIHNAQREVFMEKDIHFCFLNHAEPIRHMSKQFVKIKIILNCFLQKNFP